MHIVQPLDNGAFGALKQHWSKACHRYCSKNFSKVVNRYNFCEVFHLPWLEGMAMRNIIARFRAAFYPPAKDVVLLQIPGKSNDSKPKHLYHLFPFVHLVGSIHHRARTVLYFWDHHRAAILSGHCRWSYLQKTWKCLLFSLGPHFYLLK